MMTQCSRIDMPEVVLAVPPLVERKAVFEYLLKCGFSRREAKRFNCLGREYAMAVDAMKYEQSSKAGD